MTGTVLSTCTPTPASSHSRRRRNGSQQLLSTSRKSVPSARTIRALHSSMCSSRTGLPGGSSGGSTCVWMSMLLMLAAALLASRIARVAPVSLEDGQQLLDDIRQMERFAIELVAARVANPEEGILLCRKAAALDHQADGIRRALRRMRRVRGQEEDLALPDGNVDRLSGFQDPQVDVALDLIEELLAFVEVIVGARVGAAHHRHHEIPVAFP